MQRLAIVMFIALISVTTGWAAALTTRAQVVVQENEPGKTTQARVWVMNRGAMEAIPIHLVDQVGDPVRVAVQGTAQTRAARQNWEYRQVRIGAGQDPTGDFNISGADGWEVVGFFAASQPGVTIAILKRPRP